MDKVTRKIGLKCVNLNFRDKINVEKNLIACDSLIANQLQERMTTSSQIALKYISLLDVEITLIVGLFCFEENITNKTNRSLILLSNSSNHSEELTRTYHSNLAKQV